MRVRWFAPGQQASYHLTVWSSARGPHLVVSPTTAFVGHGDCEHLWADYVAVLTEEDER